ncbi:DUF4198 domain-containing protein [Fimbriiglobus ruber]|uniref:Carboxypeptidase regulatory-like domain-containing protein n=1 Tax=Fimbriiglobus ruber TaxID=1908690 RepID=A0A225DNI4_9BACT|nr:DUF4198 domain-containing protein [Fimbriiglobus ruber]OWK42942.1 hypothetical protein FRUB_02541 [Fimbriiglobus ruber]
MRAILDSRLVVTCFLLALAGCAPKLPPIVPVEGVVTINGQPLANAAVTFIPLLDHFGMEAVSVATTDAQGKFTLICKQNEQPGAVAGTHLVMVRELPVPKEMRRVIQDGRVIDAYYAKSGNRPIPPDYKSTAHTPLRVEISRATPTVTLELKR